MVFKTRGQIKLGRTGGGEEEAQALIKAFCGLKDAQQWRRQMPEGLRGRASGKKQEWLTSDSHGGDARERRAQLQNWAAVAGPHDKRRSLRAERGWGLTEKEMQREHEVKKHR